MRTIRLADATALTSAVDRWHDLDWDGDWWYQLMAETAAERLGMESDVLVQREPNLRVHPPGGQSVPWHTDADFGHLAEEWNVWVPLVKCTDDSQRLWVSHPQYGTRPVRVHIGEAFCFHGATIRHGCIRNRTDVTRYSFDFRLLAKADYRDEGRTTVRYGVPLRLGDYWREL